MRNSTERKRADEALRKSEERYRAIVEDQTEFIIRTRPDGQLIFVNQAFCRYFNVTPEQLLGHTFTIPVHPDDACLIAQKRQMLSSHYPTVVYWHRTLLEGGETRWLSWTERGLFNEAGQLVEVQSVGQDITGRKTAEEALKKRNEELHMLYRLAISVNQSTDPEQLADNVLSVLMEVLEIDGSWLHLIDESGATHALQLIAHRGLTPALVEAIQCLPFDSPASAAEASQSDRIMHSLEAIQAQLELSAPGVPLTVVSAPLQSKDRLFGMLGLYQRGTGSPAIQKQLLTTIGHEIGVAIENMRLAEKAAEIELLRELDHLRSELVANVSHELRTPLGLIKVFCGTLLRKDMHFDTTTQMEFLQDIDQEANKLETIVDNLLDLSRMQRGQLQLDKQALDLAQLIRATLALMTPQLNEYRLAYEFTAAPLRVVADGKRIEQILRNLLNNAAKYSSPNSAITLRVRQQERNAIVQVRDEGLGIPAADLGQIFERFYRVKSEATQHIGGVGLGLAICKDIIEAHGGRIWAESVLGQGSTFCFTLPLTEGELP